MSSPWVFVEDVDAPVLSDADRHHLERVLRTRVGDEVVVSDGTGRWRTGRLAGAGAVEALDDVVAEARPTPEITIAFALTKGERPELAVQKLTELGADRIVPFTAARSVVRWDERRAATNVERLRRVVRESGMQCRRAWLPVVEGVATFAEAAALPGAVLADRDGEPPSLAHPTILVGPEGGWSDDERRCGLGTVRLADAVLRAETAAMVGAGLLTALRGGTVAPLT